jgi:endonuclease YncB( thermonuclease family)
MLIMPNFKIFGWITVVFLLPAALYPAAAGIHNFEIDLEGIANNVIDGDTFDMTASNGTQYRIRLADVDAPERYEEGYAESGEYLRDLVSGESVYLDIDDLYVWDNHGNGNRLVAIIYINYNSSYLLNVNEALFQAGHLLKREYDNEFTPYNWSLYVSLQESPEFPSTIIAVVVIAALLLALTFTRRRQHMTEKHSNNR